MTIFYLVGAIFVISGLSIHFLILLKFINNLQIEIWKNKSILGIISQEYIAGNEEIKTFIMQNSNNTILKKVTR